MAHPYNLTIPGDIGELDDLLGWMVLSCPDFPSDYPGRNIDTAFEELQLGIERVVREVGKRDTLHRMAKDVRSYCDDGQVKVAIQTLNGMSELLRRKAVTNDNS